MAEVPVGIDALHRPVHEVARENRFLATGPNPNRDMARRVARRRFQAHLVIDGMVHVDDNDPASLDNRQHIIVVGPVSAVISPCFGSFQFAAGHDERALGKVGTQRPFTSRVFQPQ